MTLKSTDFYSVLNQDSSSGAFASTHVIVFI